MRMTKGPRLGLKIASLGIGAMALACSSNDPAPNPGRPTSGATTSGASGAAGSTVTGAVGGAGGSNGSSGSGGTGDAGSAGSLGTGGAAGQPEIDSGPGGSGDAAPTTEGGSDAGGCQELGTPGKTGRQCDPGTMGNGRFEEVEPATGVPPEGMPARRGMLTASTAFTSTIYGYAFNYQVFVPVQYVQGKPAALMIFQDGGNYIQNFRTPQVFETLIDAKTMPVTIAVFITPGNNRSAEYDSITEKYVRFLTEELIPQKISPMYTLVDDPNGWAIGGHSSGGICAFTAGWLRPAVFHKILTNSGSFVNLQGPMSGATYPGLVGMTKPIKPLRVTMSSGTTDLGGWRVANDNMAMALDMAGYPYRYVRHGGSHGPDKWVTFEYPNALRWLWRGYTLPQYP